MYLPFSIALVSLRNGATITKRINLVQSVVGSDACNNAANELVNKKRIVNAMAKVSKRVRERFCL